MLCEGEGGRFGVIELCRGQWSSASGDWLRVSESPMDWKKLAPVGLKSSFDERQRGGVGVFPCCLFVGRLLDLVDGLFPGK